MELSSIQSVLLGGVVLLVLVAIPAVLWLVPPPFFSSATVAITRGTSVQTAAQKLADAGVVYTPELVTIPFRISGENISAGTYKFDDNINALNVIDRLESGTYGIPQASIVIPEGFTNKQIAEQLEEVLGSVIFSKENFLELAAPHQGYLYPDTYQLHADAGAQEVITQMRENFSQKIAPLEADINAFPYSLAAVIKMASLIELEAANFEDRRKIASVLWNRMERDMPLQVDAVFMPLLGKGTYELTEADLQIDSPYNLYTNTGLPPRPIANPGRAAIKATITPVPSSNLYYLSSPEGNFYYAKTLEEHGENRRKYLKD